MPPRSEPFNLFFAPEDWTAVRRFGAFIGPPFSDREVIKGTRTAASHLEKFDVLANLATRLAPNLRRDREELDRDGFTPAINSREFAALMEVLICELYAALDGARRALFGAYRSVSAVQNESTRKLFRRAAENRYGPEFPEDVRLALANASATWFPGLCELRTEITHGHTGSCHLNTSTGHVSYLHDGLGTRKQAKVIPDIIGHVNETALATAALTEAVFGHLYGRLETVEKRVTCGIHQGRLYERLASPEPALSRHSGRCSSHIWFEDHPGLECPLRNACGAYAALSEQPAAPEHE